MTSFSLLNTFLIMTEIKVSETCISDFMNRRFEKVIATALLIVNSMLWVVSPLVSAEEYINLNDENDVGLYEPSVADEVAIFEYSDDLQTLGSTLDTAFNGEGSNSENLEQAASDIVEQQFSKYANDWLAPFGTVGAEIELDYLSEISSAEFDFLTSIYHSTSETNDSLVYVQSGFVMNDDSTYNGRDFVHAGIGFRSKYEEFMWGLNTFLDADLDRDHLRGSVGVEGSHQFVNLSSNFYFPLSDWKASPDSFESLSETLYERAAYGVDINATGLFSTQFPALTWSTSFGQFFGEHVEVSTGEEPIKDAYIFNAGVNYQPLPLVTFSFDFEEEKGTRNQFNAGMNFEYKLGVPWRKQLDPSQVAMANHFDAQMLSLVERDHNIRLEYEKRDELNYETTLRFNDDQVMVGESSVTSLSEWVVLEDIQQEDIVSFAFEGSAAQYVKAGATILESVYEAPPVIQDSIKDNLFDLDIKVTLHDGRSASTASSLSIYTRANMVYELTDIEEDPISGNNVASTAMRDGYQLSTVLFNEDGRPLENRNVTFNTNNEGAYFSEDEQYQSGGDEMKSIAVRTDSNGRAKVYLKSTESGLVDYNISAQGAQTVPSTLLFQADRDVSSAVVELEVTQNFAMANQIDENQVRVVINDQHGNPIVGGPVTLTTNNPYVTITPLKRDVSDRNGVVLANITSSKRGIFDITATYRSVTETQSDVSRVSFSADLATTKIVNMQGTPGDVPANGQTPHHVVLMVRDDNDNVVRGIEVELNANNGATVTPSVVRTDGQGVVKANVTNTSEGLITVSANIKGTQDVSETQVSFVPDNATREIVEFEVEDNGAVADDADLNKLSVVVLDKLDNEVDNVQVSFSSNNGATFPFGSTALTNSQGYAEVEVSHIQSGVSLISAELDGIITKPLPINFVADETTAKVGYFDVVTRMPKVANGKDAHTLEVQVVDANNNPVSNYDVAFTSFNQNAILPATATTNNQGIATVDVTSTDAAKVDVDVQLATGDRAQVSMVFIADKSTGLVQNMGTVIDDSPADNNTANQVSVELLDINGNPIKNEVVIFHSATSGFSIVPSNGGKTDNAGLAYADIVSTNAVAGDIYASYLDSSTSESVNFVPTAGMIDEIEVIANKVIADGTSEAEIYVTLRDINKNPVPNADVKLVSSSITANFVGGDTVQTDADGLAIVKVTDTTQGANIVTAEHNGTTGEAKLLFVANKLTSEIVSLTPQQAEVPSDGKSEHVINVEVKDANGNPVKGEQLDVIVQNGSAVIKDVTETDNIGMAKVRVTNTILELSRIQVTSTSSGQSDTVTLTFGPVPYLGPVRTVVDGSVANSVAQNSLEVLVLDKSTNLPLANETIFVSTRNPNFRVLTPVLNTGNDGKATALVTSTEATLEQINVTLVSTSEFVTSDMEFIADISTAQPTLTRTNGGSDIIADNLSTVDYDLLVEDHYGNLVPGAVVNLITSVGTLSDTEVTSDSQGLSSFTVTATDIGDATISATADVSSLTDSATVKFIPDLVSATPTVTVVTNNEVADGASANDFDVFVLDQYSNIVANERVNFTSSGGVLGQVFGVTDPSGEINGVKVTNLVAEVVSVSAEVEVSTHVDSENMEFIANINTATPKLTRINGSGDVIANDTDVADYEILLEDINGNVVSGETIDITTDVGSANAGSVTTDPRGKAQFNVSSPDLGLATITVSTSSASLEDTATVEFVGDIANAVPAISVVTDNAIADGNDMNEFDLTLLDPYNHPMEGRTVNLSASGGARLSVNSAITDVNGQILGVTLTNNVVGAVTVTATVADSGKFVDQDFIFNLNIYQVTIDDSSDGRWDSAPWVHFQVNDVNGQPAASTAVTINVAGKHSESFSTTTDGSGKLLYTVPGSSFDYGNYSVSLEVDDAAPGSSNQKNLYVYAYDPYLAVTHCLDDGDTWIRIKSSSSKYEISNISMAPKLTNGTYWGWTTNPGKDGDYLSKPSNIPHGQWFTLYEGKGHAEVSTATLLDGRIVEFTSSQYVCAIN
ncbi:adhesin/invasin [Vibrio crassostreae]|nr:adhesin/invasin [Vibrio crassostreae]